MSGIEESDLAWVAGVIDAIGRIGYRKIKTCTLPVLAVSSGDLTLLDKLSALSGTKHTVTKREYAKVGCSQHCKEKHKHVLSISARWMVTGTRATIMMKAIEPYIVTKTMDIAQGIALGDMAFSKDATAKKMMELGWKAA